MRLYKKIYVGIIIISLLFFGAYVPAANANEGTVQDHKWQIAMEILELTYIERERINSTSRDEIRAMYEASFEGVAPPENIDEFIEFHLENMMWLIDQTAKLKADYYVERLSASDLEAWLRFVRTSAGQHLLDLYWQGLGYDSSRLSTNDQHVWLAFELGGTSRRVLAVEDAAEQMIRAMFFADQSNVLSDRMAFFGEEYERLLLSHVERWTPNR